MAWAWVGSYDHVVLAQLWGDMTGLPKRLPRFTRELQQYWEFASCPKLPPVPQGNHDAHPVVNEETAANGGSRVNLNAGEEAPPHR